MPASPTATKRISRKSRRPLKGESSWTFLTNHAHVLLCLVREPQARMRDVAELVGITERAVQRIIADLEEAGYLRHVRLGRRNRYEVCEDLTLRHPIERHQRVSSLTALVLGPERRGKRAAAHGGIKGRPSD